MGSGQIHDGFRGDRDPAVSAACDLLVVDVQAEAYDMMVKNYADELARTAALAGLARTLPRTAHHDLLTDTPVVSA